MNTRRTGTSRNKKGQSSSGRRGKKTPEYAGWLDEKLLGRPIGGTLEERLLLQDMLQNILDRNGEEWVRRNRVRLIEEAEGLSYQGELKELARRATRRHTAELVDKEE